MKKLVIFDMDGTILNTLDDMTDSCNFILQKYGFPLHTIDEVKYFVGNGIPKLIERALPSDVDKETFDNVLADFIQYYELHSADKTRPYDGVIDLIQSLKNHGYMIAVNTNKVESAAIELCKTYFPNLFDIISGSRKGMPPKPAPDGVYEILERANVTKEEAVFIGDSDVDLQTGINAGTDVIGVDWGFRGADFLKSQGATNIAMQPKDVEEIVLRLL